MGIDGNTIFTWTHRYREYGEEGLRRQYGANGKPRLASAVQARITAIKKQNPHFGVKRISQLLRRMFFLPASAETVRRALHREKLITPRKKKKKNPSKPRFFERATPNQMWQSDICCIRINHQNAYLIGFMDDYSRYLVGLGVYRSQTAENVVETYRRAMGEYGPPKEMLTDNGRQYTNWRGKTAFEKEMAKDRIHHFRSSPHHPQTLGKIERFWKTIQEEFLNRARFDSFESAQERVAYWVKYYNHKRPNQGIGDLCPAERFFQIQKDVRAVMEKGVAENVEELALRGKPQTPFYLVGRMGQKSVVIRAEKGEVQMEVDGAVEPMATTWKGDGQDENDRGKREAGTEDIQREGKEPGGVVVLGGTAQGVGDLPEPGDRGNHAGRVAAASPERDAVGAGAGGNGGQRDGAGADGRVGAVDDGNDGRGERSGGDDERGREGGIEQENGHEGTEAIQRAGEVSGGAIGMVGEAESGGDEPGAGSGRRGILAVAGTGDGGYIAGAGTEVDGGGNRTGAGPVGETARGPEGAGAAGAPAETGATPATAAAWQPGSVGKGSAGDGTERIGGDEGRRPGSELGGEDRPSAERTDDGGGSKPAVGREPEDVLREGERGLGRAAGSGDAPSARPTQEGERSGKGSAGEADPGLAGGGSVPPATDPDPGSDGRHAPAG
jgi:transposase InsO family protein